MDQAINEPADGASPSVDYGRPHDIEELSNRAIIHPLSDRVVRLGVKLGVSANAVSFAGLACGLMAAIAYTQVPNAAFVIAGFLLMVIWHILDGADGRLARATGTSSAFGRVIDGVCDHLVYTAVYIALTLKLIASGYSLDIWWLVVGAGLSHAIQAAGYEERRQKYQRRMKGTDRAATAGGLLTIEGKKSLLAGIYDLVQKLVAGGDYGFDDALTKLKQTKGDAHMATLAIEQTVPMVKSWSILNANNRTLLIFLFCLAGEPLYYFAFELTVLNLVLIILMIAEWRHEKQLVSSVERLYAR